MTATPAQSISLTRKPADHTAGSADDKLPGIKDIIAVASGKGGVGKSTVTVNLACALQRLLAADGKAGVGIMDCDIYGPSIPLMLGACGRPEIENDLIVPLENFGVRTMSMGFLVDEDTPVVSSSTCHQALAMHSSL